MKVEGNISDLFFNTNCDDAKVMKGGNFVEFDRGKLEESAAMALGCLRRLGVQNLPSAADLVTDFMERV